jgi:hypothetical protein
VDAATGEIRLNHLQPMLLREIFDSIEIGRIRSVPFSELIWCQLFRRW